jgi:signal transduction histidine kinase
VETAWEKQKNCSQNGPFVWEDPKKVPLLPDLLHLAKENLKQTDRFLIDRLQTEVDHMQKALETQCASEKDRLQELKLKALAEMAAGAGHEINNPLAVISGQAQYLLAHDSDPERLKSLKTIVNQAQRIHQILNDLMHFAKPGEPHPQEFLVEDIITEVVAALQEMAQQRQVRLDWLPGTSHLKVFRDPAQLRISLQAILRNALEAAPIEGWAAVKLESSGKELQIIVEDNGPGPTASVREHMFDPFYSGRSAGRGRGLGLPTAWRLAKQQGGNLRYLGHQDGCTRFVLSLPMTDWKTPDHEVSGTIPMREAAPPAHEAA